MPRTKARTSSKKKKKQKKEDCHSADDQVQEEANAGTNEAALNSNDSLEQALAWIDGGKVDPKHLVKTLPHTARDLRNGACDPNDLAKYLAHMSHCSKQMHSSIDGATRKKAPGVEPFVAVLTRTVPHLEANRDLCLQFRSTLHKRIAQKQSSVKKVHIPSLICNVKDAFDDTCKEWEDTITEKLYGGRIGEFRRVCPTFGAPVEKFKQIVSDLHHRIMRVEVEMYDAAYGVSMGYDQINETCWECDSVLADTKQCRGCKAALYCCQGCQRSAWKAGHKDKCSILGAQYVTLNESFAIVDSVHSRGVMDVPHLRPEIEYLLAICCSKWPYIQNKPRLFEGNKNPSMNIFYDNLGRIARGEWWIYSDTATLEQYNAKQSQEGDRELYQFQMLTFLMCFGCFGCAVEVVMTDLAPIVAMFFGDAFDAISSWCDFSEKMPSARYLQLYHGVHKCVNDTKRKIIRRHEKCVAQKELRMKFHK